MPGFSVTGLLFHQIYLAELAGVTLGTWAANYVIYAACVVAGTLISGQLVDRFTGRRVAAHLLTTDEPVRPSVEQRELALFFSDLQGFTSLAERAPPETLLLQVSEYFEVVTDAITEEGGTIDKFIGDAVMAFWGAPAHLMGMGGWVKSAFPDFIF